MDAHRCLEAGGTVRQNASPRSFTSQGPKNGDDYVPCPVWACPKSPIFALFLKIAVFCRPIVNTHRMLRWRR
jgi:hypothetical protein